MRSLGLVATTLAAALLLSACASSTRPTAAPEPPSSTATPTPTVARPAFLETAQVDGDRVPDDVADRMHVDPASTRYQGEWDERAVYLGIADDTSVCVITQHHTDDTAWRAGCGSPSAVVTVQFSDGATVKFVPMSSSATPEGWTRLSDYTFAM